MSPEESVALLTRAREGSAEALGELFERSAPKLLARIRLHLGPALRSRLESRDILQSTLLKALRSLDSFAGAGTASLLAWLSSIAENEIRDQAAFHRRGRRDAGREEPLSGAAPEHLAAALRSASSRLIWSEEQARLERALEALGPEHRQVIILRKLEEMPYGEISRRLGKSPDACRMLLARAMTALTLALEAGDEGEGGREG